MEQVQQSLKNRKKEADTLCPLRS
jgi:hypothetical protein